MSQNNRRTRESTKWQNSLTDLPDHVLIDILSRLPLKTLIACKCVCRVFNDLSTQCNASPAIIVLIRTFKGLASTSTWHLHLFDPEVDTRRRRLKFFNRFPFHIPRYNDAFLVELWNSCNGLVHLSGMRDGEAESIILNPLTNEYVSVPCGRAGGIQVLGFSALANQYKVLRISRPEMMKMDEFYRVQIHNVGSGLWRDIETGSRFRCLGSASYLNGAAYMLWESQLVYFDFDKEEFGEIALPSELTSNGSYQGMTTTGVLGGCLCVSINYCEFGGSVGLKRFDLWVMRKSDGDHRETWSKEFVIDAPLISKFRGYAWLLPYQVLSSGEILMLWEDYGWFCYHPKYKTLRFLGFKKSLKDRYMFVNNFVPSFVSLKDQLSIDNVMVQRGLSRYTEA